MSARGGPERVGAAGRLRDALATYKSSEDLISIGAYQPGANASLDEAVAMMPHIKAFLCQASRGEVSAVDAAVQHLLSLFPSGPEAGFGGGAGFGN